MPIPADSLPWVIAGGVALYVLVKAAGETVERAVAVALAWGLTEELIAISVIAVGTSLPEIGAHLSASAGIVSGSLDPTLAAAAVLGGNMGSSTTQQFLLLGLFLVGYGRYAPSDSLVRNTYVPMLLGFALTWALAWDRTVSRVDGLVLVGAFAAYMYYNYNRRPRTSVVTDGASTRPAWDLAVALASLAAVLASAFVALRAIEVVITGLALNGSMVGVVTIGLAAALPELSTVIESLRRRAPAIALGTLVGSNVVNPLLGIGLGGLVSTYQVPPSIVLWDLPFKFGVGLGGLVYLRWRPGDELTRRDGFTLVGVYFVFLAGRFVLFPG